MKVSGGGSVLRPCHRHRSVKWNARGTRKGEESLAGIVSHTAAAAATATGTVVGRVIADAAATFLQSP